MSYDLDFWKYQTGVTLDDQTVYDRLSHGENIEGFENLPIQSIITRINEEFADWEKQDELNFDSCDRGSFQLYTTRQFFRVDCYGMEGEDMNRFIDIANEFGCPLYDPQIGKRYDRG